MSSFIVETAGLTKIYQEGGVPLPVLVGVDVQIEFGEIVALRGPSGSGKSTLLNILGCLDRPTRGHYWLGGRDVSGLDRTAQAWVRLHYIGFASASATGSITAPISSPVASASAWRWPARSRANPA